MESNKFLKLIVIILLVIIAGFLLKGKVNFNFQKTGEDKSSLDPMPSGNVSFSNQCSEFASYSPEDYYEGWKGGFKKENQLSDDEYTAFVKVSSVRLVSGSGVCSLVVDYMITRDWFSASKKDLVRLGNSPIVSPENLPIKSGPSEVMGVSLINLKSSLIFKNKEEAAKFYINKYPRFKEVSDMILYPLNINLQPALFFSDVTLENKCYQGVVFLNTAETTYKEIAGDQCMHPSNMNPNF